MKVAITINGVNHAADVEPRLLLVHFLRDQLGLTGTHIGCESSTCGACTVLLHGKAVKSCTTLAVQANGMSITTIEGLAGDGAYPGNMHPVQQGFWEEHGLQCGYCTPGMILSACDLLTHNLEPSESEIRGAISGNLCRCTGYQHIVSAIQNAAGKMRASERARGRDAAAASLPMVAASREDC